MCPNRHICVSDVHICIISGQDRKHFVGRDRITATVHLDSVYSDYIYEKMGEIIRNCFYKILNEVRHTDMKAPIFFLKKKEHYATFKSLNSNRIPFLTKKKKRKKRKLPFHIKALHPPPTANPQLTYKTSSKFRVTNVHIHHLSQRQHRANLGFPLDSSICQNGRFPFALWNNQSLTSS